MTNYGPIFQDRGVTPASEVTSNSSWCLGWAFTVNSACWLSDLWVYREFTENTPSAIGLFLGGNTTPVVNIVPGTFAGGTGWRSCGYTGHYAFVVGSTYYIMANFPSSTSGYCSTASFFTGSNPYTDGPITVLGVTNTGSFGTFTSSGTIIYPTTGSATWWAIDLSYTDVDPTTINVNLGVASASATAQPFTRSKARTLGLASASGTAQALAASKLGLPIVGRTVRGW